MANVGTLAASITSDPHSGQYTKKGTNNPTSGLTNFSGDGMNIALTYTGGDTGISIYKIEVICLDKVVRVLDIRSASWFFGNHYHNNAYISNGNTFNIPFDGGDTRIYESGNTWAWGALSNVDAVDLTSSGSLSVKLKIYYGKNDGSGVVTLDEPEGNQTITLGTISVAGFNASFSIDTSSVTKSFFKGTAFNYNNLVCKMTYSYQSQFGGNTASVDTVTPTSVTSPNMNATGDKTITVKYNSYSATYTINVYYYAYKTKANFSSGVPSYVKKGTAQPTISYTVYYTNGNTGGTQNATISGWNTSTAGNKTITYTLVGGYTVTQTIYVADYKLSISTAPNTKNYNYNASSFSLDGLVIVGIYQDANGNNISSSTLSYESITNSNLTVTKRAWAVGSKTGTLRFTDRTTNKYVDYNQINVNGLKSISISGQKTDFAKGEAFALGSNAVITRTDYSNGVASTTTCYTYNHSSVDLNSKGRREVTFYVTGSYGEGNISASYYYYVFEFVNVSVINNIGSIIVNSTNDLPTLTKTIIGTVKATKDFGEYKNAITDYELEDSEYSVSPAIGTTLPNYVGSDNPTDSGDNTITITTSTGASIQKTVHVEINSIDNSASLEVSGLTSNGYLPAKHIYLVDETADLSGLTVTASLMTSGETNYPIKNYTKQLVLHDDNSITKDVNDLKFNSTDVSNIYDNNHSGWYDLVITATKRDGTSVSVTKYKVVCLKILSSVSYLENSQDNGYYYNGAKVTGANRVKIGSEIDTSCIKFRKHYSDGSIEDCFDSSLITSVSKNSVEKTRFLYADYDSLTTNTMAYSVTIFGSTFTMTIPFKYVSAINVTYGGQSEYNIHEELDTDTSDISITKTYNAGNYSAATTESVNVEDVTLSATGGTDCSISDLIPELVNRTNPVVTITASYQDENSDAPSVSDSFTINVKAQRDITLKYNGETKSAIYYNHGEEHSLVGYDLYIRYNTGYTETESITEEIASNVDSLYGQIVDNVSDGGLSGTITRNWHNDPVTTTYTRHTYYVDDISVTFTGVEASYFVGQILSVASVTATKTIACTDTNIANTTEDIDELTFEFRDQEFETTRLIVSEDVGNGMVLEAIYNPNNGQQAITKTTTVNIVANQLTHITLTKSNTFKDFADYVDGQHLNLAGLTINLVYNNSSLDKEISYTSDNIIIVDGNNEEVTKTAQLDTTDTGTILYVKYTGVDGITPVVIDENGLVVAANELSRIEIRTEPSVVDYRYGDLFSTDGMLIVAVYTNETEEVIYLNDEELSFSVTTNNDAYNPVGHTFNSTDDPTIADGYAVTVSYLTKTDSFNINIKNPILKEITTNFYNASEPVRRSYAVNEVFDSTGLVVTAVFANGYKETIANYTLDDNDNPLDTPLQLTTAGYVEVFVSAENPYDNSETAKTSFFIEVNNGLDVVSAILQLDDEENYNSYFVGDKFTAKGVSFAIKDSGSNSFISKNFVCDLPIGTVLKAAQNITVNVTYTSGTYTKTESYVIKVRVLNSEDVVETNTYQLAIGDANNNLITSITHDEATISCGAEYGIYPLFHEDKVSVDTNSTHTNTYGYNIYTGTAVNINDDCIGYIDLGVEGVKKAHVVFFEDQVNPIDGDGNIEVTFPHYVEGYADRINKCRFGYIFNNRLFVSGNSNMKNYDWHTQETNDQANEFTYFSDLDYCRYGSEETAIVGYDQFRDGDLLVFKEGSRNQATIYRREYKLVEATSSDGSSVGENLYEEAFPMFDVNSNGGEGALSHRSIINFEGESLVLTRSGIKAITAKDDVFNNAKFAVNISEYINTKIIYEDLENAFIFSFEEKLFLKTSRGIYVGYSDLRNEDGFYEWYFLSNINADIFFEKDNELYFANDDGEVCRFPKEEFDYLDRERTYIASGGTLLTINESENTIIVSALYSDKVVEGNDFHIITKYTIAGVDTKSLVHASLGTFVSKSVRENALENELTFDQTAYNGLINYDEDDNSFNISIEPYNEDGEIDEDKLNTIQNLFYDGRTVYLDNILGNSVLYVNVNEPYKLVEVGDNKYQLYDQYDNVVSLEGINYMRISFAVNDLAITEITDVEDYGSSGAKQFKLIGDHDQVLDLINYDYDVNNPPTYAGVITTKSVVKAYYETAPYAMGSIVNLKTILSWNIVNDTQLAGYMDIGYFASRKQGDWKYSVTSVPDSNGLDFSNYKFVNTDFTNRKLPAVYAKQRTVPNVAFIRYLFKNDEDSNIVLTTLSVVYTISNLLKGVK